MRYIRQQYNTGTSSARLFFYAYLPSPLQLESAGRRVRPAGKGVIAEAQVVGTSTLRANAPGLFGLCGRSVRAWRPAAYFVKWGTFPGLPSFWEEFFFLPHRSPWLAPRERP